MSRLASERALREDMVGFQHDPLGCVLYSFPWGQPGTELADKPGPRAWQRRALERIGEKLREMFGAGADPKTAVQEAIRLARVSGHGIGKSALIAFITHWALSTFDDTRVVITANTEKQLLTKTSPELAKWFRLAINAHWFIVETTTICSADIKHRKTWRCDLVPWSETNTEAFAGLHNEGKRIVLLFDEASAIADKVWEVAEGALTDEHTEIIWAVFGNGTRAIGRFRECFRSFKHRWDGEHIDSRSVEGTNKAQLAQFVGDYGEDSDIVKIRVRGLFPSASLRSLINEKDVDAAYGRHLRPEQYNWAPKILTLDNAWEGDDDLVIGLRQGLMFKILKVLPKNDNDVWVANLLARLEDEHQADAVFIDGGYGTGVVSVGRTLHRSWRLVWFSEESSDPGCLNKRAEMWNAIPKWLKEGGAIEELPQLRDDLLAIESVPRMDGKLQLKSKKEMKKDGHRSPGHGDALALTFAYSVALKPKSADDPLHALSGGRKMVTEQWFEEVA